MKRLTLSLLAAVLCAGGAFGQAQASRMKKTDSAEELKQIEKDWVAAMKAKDPSKLGEILEDNWVALRWDGRTVTKAEALAELKESGSSLEDIEMGPMDVRFFGSTAVVTGSDTEKSTEKGKDTSGRYVWMDVFVREGGKWRAVASQSAKVPE